MEDCANEAAVSAHSGSVRDEGGDVYAGGVVGVIDTEATALRCVNRSAVSATGQAKACAGGIAGQIAGAGLIQCRSKDAATAKGNPSRRGIVAASQLRENTITDCGTLR